MKFNRARLPRPESSTWLGLFIAVAAVITAIVGSIIVNPNYLAIFLEYLVPTLLVVFFMLYRVSIYKTFHQVNRYEYPDRGSLFQKLNTKTMGSLNEINSQQFVYFTNHDDVEVLNRVMRYITHNEPTKRLKIVAVVDRGNSIADYIAKDIEVLDRVYPGIHIEFIQEPGTFTPEKVQELSKRWRIPTNFMFISSPSDNFPYKIQELCEVCLII